MNSEYSYTAFADLSNHSTLQSDPFDSKEEAKEQIKEWAKINDIESAWINEDVVKSKCVECVDINTLDIERDPVLVKGVVYVLIEKIHDPEYVDHYGGEAPPDKTIVGIYSDENDANHEKEWHDRHGVCENKSEDSDNKQWKEYIIERRVLNPVTHC